MAKQADEAPKNNLLEFTRILIWPALALIGVVVFHTEVRGILRGEVALTIPGVIDFPGGSQAELKARLQVKFDSLETLSKDLGGELKQAERLLAEKTNQIILLEESLAETHLQMDDPEEAPGRVPPPRPAPVPAATVPVQEIQQTPEVAQLEKKTKLTVNQGYNLFHEKSQVQQAEAAESEAFKQLLAKDYSAAIDAFARAEAAVPSYHNVYELGELLKQQRAGLEGANGETLYRELLELILSQYSWGMPEDAKTAMQAELAKPLIASRQDLIDALSGDDRRGSSAQLQALYAQQPDQVKKALLASLLPERNPLSYRVNLYVALTLTKVPGGWRGTNAERQKIADLTNSKNYQDPTFRQWVDGALGNFKKS